MAGPLFSVSITNKENTEERFDILTAWRNQRMSNRISISIAEKSDEGGDTSKYPMKMITDWLRSLAEGKRWFVDVRCDQPQLLAWLNSAPAEQRSDAPF